MFGKSCCECKHWHWSEMMEEYQCWCDNCIHEGEERGNFQSACDHFEEEGKE